MWNVYGKSAGYRRNVEMGLYGDALIAFWDGFSKGTRLMIDIAKEKFEKILQRDSIYGIYNFSYYYHLVFMCGTFVMNQYQYMIIN